jgi:hypothetical protein
VLHEQRHLLQQLLCNALLGLTLVPLVIAPKFLYTRRSDSALEGGRKLVLEEPDVTTLSWQFRLAVLKDAKIDVSKTPAE